MIDQNYIEDTLKKLNTRDCTTIWGALWRPVHDAFDNEIIEEFMKYRQQFVNAAKVMEELDNGFPSIHKKSDIIKLVNGVFDCYESRKCICTLMSQRFNPEKLAEKGNVTILDTLYLPVENGKPWFDGYIIKCNKCGRHYYVGEREYHYTWYEWKEIDPITRKELGTKKPKDSDF